MEQLLDQQFEDDYQTSMKETEALVRLLFDKAAAHTENPQKFPIADEHSIEALLAAKLKSVSPDLRKNLAAAGAARLAEPEKHYRSMAAIQPSIGTAILDRARKLQLPLAATAAFATVKDRLTRMGEQLAPREPLRTPSLAPKTVELHLTRLTCITATKGELGKDHIWSAACAHDVYHRTDVLLKPFKVGKTKKNKDPIAIGKLAGSYPVLEGATGGMVFPATLFLAEKDIGGGFKDFIDNVGSLSDHQMQEVLILATAVSTTALAGFAEGAETGFGHHGILVAVALGLLGSVHWEYSIRKGRPKLVGPIRNVLKTLIKQAIKDAASKFFKDDVFPPQVIAYFLDPQGQETVDPDFVLFEWGEAQYKLEYEWRVKMGEGQAGAAAKPPTEAATASRALKNLENIDHIMVLMLENRSFDHMLGYLLQDRKRMEMEVEGAPQIDSNILSENQESFPVVPFEETALEDDPSHFNIQVAQQLWGKAIFDESYAKFTEQDELIHIDTPPPTMTGFVESHRMHLYHRDALGADYKERLGAVMKYHPAHHVPTFDLLANEFAVCKKWFSSYPGNTWVNRTIAVTGRPGTRNDNQTLICDNTMPFDEKAFTRQLDGKVDWAWYSQDVPSLVVVDASYAAQAGSHSRLRTVPQLFEDLKNNKLPSVSWVDPNFVDIGSAGEVLHNTIEALRGEGSLKEVNYSPETANDDHPPTDITHGQNFVLEVFLHLYNSPAWEKTMLVVTYDEHGGFFDHVPPPQLSAKGGAAPESGAFKWLGVRVPAIIVSPWVGRGLVSDMQFDHTSIIRTIFQKFLPSALTDPATSERVKKSNHLGWLLNEPKPRITLGDTGAESKRNVSAREYGMRAAIALRVEEDRRRNGGVKRAPTELQLQMAEGRKRFLEMRQGKSAAK